MATLNNTIEILNSKSTKILFGDLYGQDEEITEEYIKYMGKYNNNGIYKVNIRKYGAVNINSLLA